MTASLRDGYNNAIIPALGINRNVELRTNSINTLYLNQYLRTGNLGAFITPASGVQVPLIG